ncbi:hypothetical protein V6N11_083352 [Hibiscus sabdariffa]|uniref:Uncharacterized protein n=1 Tax=Hibiscus sabdariffa TaxID=183260 RepID=A0ABR2QLL6_9ROSI
MKSHRLSILPFHVFSYTPQLFIFTISIETGRSSSNMVMLFGISTTGLYLVIFVMKFLAMLKSDDIEPVNLGLSSDRTSNSGN